MQRHAIFVTMSLAVVVLVAAIIAAPALVDQYRMVAFNTDEEMSIPTGIAEDGFSPVTVSGYLKKKTTLRKKATVWKKKTFAPWTTDLLPGLDPDQDNWVNDVTMQYMGVDPDPFFEAVGAAVNAAGETRPMRWTHTGDGPWMMDPLPPMAPGVEGEVLGVWHLPPNWDLKYMYAGWFMEAGDPMRAAVWSEDPAGVKTMTLIPDVPGGGSWASDGLIASNDTAYLIGGADDAGMTLPLLWTWPAASDPDAAMATPLPLLQGGQQGKPMVILENAAILIAGWSENFEGVRRPVSWMLQDGAWIVDDLGVIDGDGAGMVLGGLYHGGEISLVGSSIGNLGKRKTGVLWHKVTPSPSWTLTDLSQATLMHKVMPQNATGIDAKGRIIGYGLLPPDPIAAYAVADTDTTGPYAFVLTPDPPTDVRDTPAPAALSVAAYPNPFNPDVTVEITPGRSGPATVTVHDAKGRYVATLFDGRLEAAHPRRIAWDGTGASGTVLASGVYFVRVQCAGEVASRRVVLLK